jgi:hypothetical protein
VDRDDQEMCLPLTEIYALAMPLLFNRSLFLRLLLFSLLLNIGWGAAATGIDKWQHTGTGLVTELGFAVAFSLTFFWCLDPGKRTLRAIFSLTVLTIATDALSFWLVFPAVANPTDNIVAAYLVSAVFSSLLFVGIIGRFFPIRFKRQTAVLLFIVLALLLIPADHYIRQLNFLDPLFVDPLSVCLVVGQIVSSIVLGLGIATQPRMS